MPSHHTIFLDYILIAIIDAFGKNEEGKKVFWAQFIAMATLMMARVLNPATAQQIVRIITVNYSSAYHNSCETGQCNIMKKC
jgi:hypothetical protein